MSGDSTAVARFEHFSFKGTPRDRGLAYGEQLRSRIRTTYDLYSEVLFSLSALSDPALMQRAQLARQLIATFDPELVVELDAVAIGAKLPEWQIYALNARTEILNTRAGECTAVAFPAARILGQNWDWVEQLEDLSVTVEFELENGCRILALTEPGMLGKIGFNNAGLGVCLNILFCPHRFDGVPIHVLIRALLGCANVSEARTLIARAGNGKASHLLIVDDTAAVCSTEFAGDEQTELESNSDTMVHTNHCLAPQFSHHSRATPSTLERYACAREHLSGSDTRDGERLQQLLLDDSAGQLAINRHYSKEALLNDQAVGTCATVIMELAKRSMRIKRGPGSAANFYSLSL